MDVSYDPNHRIYQYVEKCVNKTKHFRFDKMLLISTNRFLRYDLSIQLVKNLVYESKDTFINHLDKNLKDNDTLRFLQSSISGSEEDSDSEEGAELISHINNEYENDIVHMTAPLNNKTHLLVQGLIREYEDMIKCSFKEKNDSIQTSMDFDHSFIAVKKICIWIFNKLERLRDLYKSTDQIDCKNELLDPGVTDETSEFISLMVFLGLIEWFHLLVIKMTVMTERENNDNKCLIVLGEETVIEYEHMTSYSIHVIVEFFTSQYNSHSIVYLISDKYISVYDPDVDKGKIATQIDQLCGVTFTQYLSIELIPSIQSLTDDQYCIFHSINFILRLVEMIDEEITPEKISNFMKYIQQLNKITNFRDVCTFIKTLDIVAQHSIVMD